MFNVGWVSFRRNENAFACLHWWRNKCIQWCYDRPENDCFADQKYLDKWPALFQGVIVLRHKGANLAPWNIANYQLTKRAYGVWVDEQPLIFFHFHGFKQIGIHMYGPNFGWYKVRCTSLVRRNIFAPYIRALLKLTNQGALGSESVSLAETARPDTPNSPSARTLSHLRRSSLRRQLHLVKGILEQRYILAINNRVM